MLEIALATFGVTLGALMAFGRMRSGPFWAFAMVGRRVTRGLAQSPWIDVLVGVLVHAGQCVAIGAAAALMLGAGRIESRIRTALIVVLIWEMAARIAWLGSVRVDVAADFSFWPRALLAVLIGAAVVIAPRRFHRTDV
jgi:hypothetical protein